MQNFTIKKIDDNLDYMKRYYNKTSITKLNIYICTICGLICNSYDTKYLYEIDKLKKFSDLLHYKKLDYFDKFENNFIFKYPFDILNDMVLDVRGFDIVKKQINICDYCIKFLKKCSVPHKALVNNLYIGQTPDCLKDLTIIEEILISRNRLYSKVFKINAKKAHSQYKYKGNVISFQQNPDDLLTLLPCNHQLENVQIIFVGNKVSDNDLIKKIFSVRKQKVFNALIWLKHNNILYTNVQISNVELNLLPNNDIPDI